MASSAPARRRRLPWLLVLLLLGLGLLLCALGGWRVAQAFVARPTVAPRGTLTIVSSLPMVGSQPPIARAIQLRLDQAGGQACGGQYAVRYSAWDDASAAAGDWDQAVEAANARRAAADPGVVAYLGPFNSGAAKISIPILNRAGPLVMIGLGNTYAGLTQASGGLPGEPEIYYPTGLRNYTRVNMTDDVQGGVAALFIHDTLQARSVYVLDDGSPYGQSIAEAFQAAAGPLGLTLVGRAHIDPNAAGYQTLMGQISLSQAGRPPDAIYAAMLADNNAAQVLKDKVAVMGDNRRVKYIGPQGIKTLSFIEAAGARVAEGVYASQPGPPPEQLPPATLQFSRDYDAHYGGHLSDPYAIFGYEAMSVTLAAIERVCAAGGDPASRRELRDAVFSTRNFNGALGVWSFDANGDISLTATSFYQVQGGAFVEVGR